MDPWDEWKQQLESWRHAWALSVAALTGLMLLWIPVGRRIMTGRDHIIDTIDTATMPGLIFQPGDDGNPTPVRIAAGLATAAVIGCAILTYIALQKRPDALVGLGVLAVINVLTVIGIYFAMDGARESVEPGEYGDIVEGTSGLILWAAVPLLLTVIVNRALGYASREPAASDRTTE